MAKNVNPVSDLDPRAIRRQLRLNQTEFWSAIGVTQSGGSRYEGSRGMPKTVQILLRLAHVEQIDINAISHEDWEVIHYLRANEPELFKSLKRSARAHAKKCNV